MDAPSALYPALYPAEPVATIPYFHVAYTCHDLPWAVMKPKPVPRESLSLNSCINTSQSLGLLHHSRLSTAPSLLHFYRALISPRLNLSSYPSCQSCSPHPPSQLHNLRPPLLLRLGHRAIPTSDHVLSEAHAIELRGRFSRPGFSELVEEVVEQRQTVTRSNSGADSVDRDSQNWWRKWWNSVKRSGKWSQSVTDDVGSCCSGPKLQYLVRKFNTDRKTIYGSRPSGFLYDPPSYELNFDHGHRREEDYQVQSSSLSAVKTGKSASSLNPRKSLKGGTQSLQVIGSSRA